MISDARISTTDAIHLTADVTGGVPGGRSAPAMRHKQTPAVVLVRPREARRKTWFSIVAASFSGQGLRSQTRAEC